MSVITVRQALNDAMREEMERDDSIFIIGCDVGLRGNPFGVTKGLMAQFGEKAGARRAYFGGQFYRAWYRRSCSRYASDR